MLTKFPDTAGELKVEFEMLMTQLCSVSTISEYEQIKSRLLERFVHYYLLWRMGFNGGWQEGITYFQFSGAIA